MSEKVPPQKQASTPDQEEVGSLTMAPPVFELAAGEDDGSGNAATSKQQDPQSADKTSEEGGGYTTHDNGQTIVTIPKNASGPLPILVIVGGISYATKDWMKGQTPPSLFESHILSFSNHGTGYTKTVKPSIEAAMTKDNAKGNYKALIGFSKGGERVNLAKADESWSFLGMIDPSVPDGGGTYPCPVYMVWNTWGSNSIETDNRSELDRKINSGKQAGASVRDTKSGHKGMPKRWFDLYGSKL